MSHHQKILAKKHEKNANRKRTAYNNRFSPSWVDDQRQEHMFQHIPTFDRRYKKYSAKRKLDAVAKGLNNHTFNSV